MSEKTSKPEGIGLPIFYQLLPRMAKKAGPLLNKVETILLIALLAGLILISPGAFANVKSDTLRSNIPALDSLNLVKSENPVQALIKSLPIDNKDTIEWVSGQILEAFVKSNKGLQPERSEDYYGLEILFFLKSASDTTISSEYQDLAKSLIYEYLNHLPMESEAVADQYLKKNKKDEFCIRIKIFSAVYGNNVRAARKYVSHLLSVNPSSLPGNAMQAMVLYNEKKWAESRDYFTKTIEIFPEYANGYQYRGKCNKELNLPEEAKRDFIKSLEYNPDNMYLQNELGVLYLAEEPEIAITCFKKAIELNPDFLWPQNNIALAYKKTGDRDSALYYFDRTITLEPNYDRALNNRGDLYLAMENYEKAISDYSRCIELKPENPNYYKDRAEAYFVSNEMKLAIDDFKQAFNLADDYAYAVKRTGDCYMKMNDYTTAIGYYDKAIHLRPLWENAINARGDSYYYLGQLPEAMKDYNHCIRLDSTFKYYYRDRGNTWFGMGRTEKAISDFKKALELDKDYDYAWRRIADCYYVDDDYEKAIENYNKAIAIDSLYTYAYFSRGMSHYNLNEYDTAIADLNKACETDSTNQSIYGNLGWIYYCKNDFDRCIIYSKKAVELDDDAYYAKFNMALATLRSGNRDEANELYRTFLMESLIKNVDISGAISDLKKLVSKNIMVDEASYILHDILKSE